MDSAPGPERRDAATLEEALATRQIELPAATRDLLRRWLERVRAANLHVNLTRHTSWSAFVDRDLTDVLKLSPLLREGLAVLDIGSGGGVPGLVLAAIRPDLEVSLCESIGKKARLLTSFCDELGLPVTVFHDRAENVLDEAGFGCCTARAVGPLWKILTWFDGRWAHARALYAFKGPRWPEEVEEAKQRKLTKRLVIQPAARYRLLSTDPEAPPIDSFILKIAPARE